MLSKTFNKYIDKSSKSNSKYFFLKPTIIVIVTRFKCITSISIFVSNVDDSTHDRFFYEIYIRLKPNAMEAREIFP